VAAAYARVDRVASNRRMDRKADGRIGTMRGFLTAYAIPCKQNNDWFLNKDFKRMSHERGDQCRLYAMVTTCGNIAVGNTFELFTDR
jgi:hypothetical protein